MSILDIREGWTGCEAGGSGRGSSARRSATRVFTFTTTTGTDRAIFTWPATRNGVTIPAPGTPHPDDAALLSEVPQVTKTSPSFYTVHVPYTTPDPNSPGDSDRYEDPLAAPADISWDDVEENLPYDVDLDWVNVANTMREPFDPPLTRRVADPLLIIERNQASFDPDTKLDYDNTVNTDAFWGAAAGRAKMDRIKARTVYAETAYWKVRYAIAFRMEVPLNTPEGKAWWRCVRNDSSIYLDDNQVQQRVPDGKTETLITEGGSKNKLAKKYPSDPHIWLYFKERRELSWAGLGLEG